MLLCFQWLHLFIRDCHSWNSSGVVGLFYYRCYDGGSMCVDRSVLRINTHTHWRPEKVPLALFFCTSKFLLWKIFLCFCGLWSHSFFSLLLSWGSMFFSVQQPCQVGRVVWVIVAAHTTAELTFTTSQTVGLFWGRFFCVYVFFFSQFEPSMLEFLSAELFHDNLLRHTQSAISCLVLWQPHYPSVFYDFV